MARITLLGMIIAVALTATAMLSLRTEPTSAGVTTLPGDTNCNGVVSIEDAQLIAQFVVGRVNELSCDPPGPAPTAVPTPTPTVTPTPTATPTPSPTLQAGEVRVLALAYISGDDAPWPYSNYLGWSCYDARWIGTHWEVTCSGRFDFESDSDLVYPEVCVYEVTRIAAIC